MTRKGNLHSSVILVTVMASLISIGALASKMNIFLISTINMFSISALLFLVYEKRLIKNFSAVWKTSLSAGIFLAASYITLIAGTSLTSSMNALLFIFIPAAFFSAVRKGNKPLRLIFLAGSLALVIANILVERKTDGILGIILLLLSSVSAYYFISWGFRRREAISLYSKEIICLSSFITAIISFIVFYLTKPGFAPVLSLFEQYHLINMILFGSLLPAFFFTFSTPALYGSDMRVISIVFAMTGILLSFADFSLLLIPAFILVSIAPFLKGTAKKKGFTATEVMAIITLAAIIISLIFPFVKAFSVKSTIASDIKGIKSGTNRESFELQIGNLYVRQLDGFTRCIYENREGRIKSYPIQ